MKNILLKKIPFILGLLVFVTTNVWSQTYSIQEGFSTTSLPSGWTGDVYFNSTANNGILTGGNGAGFNANNKYLQTITVDNPGVLTFYTKGSAAASAISIRVLMQIDGGGWSTIGDYPKPHNSTWTLRTININQTENNVIIKFEAYDRTGNSLYLDDIQLTEVAASSSVLFADPTSITGLDYNLGNGPSTPQLFSLIGTNLDGSNVTVTAPTDFEICETESGTYGETITLTSFDGTETTIYVRLAAGKVAGNYSGNVTITGGGATEITVAVSGTVNGPKLNVTPSTITALNYFEDNGPSVSQTFLISGTLLDGSNVVLTAPTNFEICETESGTYGETITLTSFNGTETTIYVRLAADKVAGNYSGNVTITGGGASEKTVALSGKVTGALALPYSNTFADATATGEAVSAGFTLLSCTQESGYIRTALNGYIETPVINFQNYSYIEVTYYVATYGGATGQVMSLEISNDGGNIYTELGSAAPTSSTYIEKKVIIDLTGTYSVTNGKLRFKMTAGSNSTRFKNISIILHYPPVTFYFQGPSWMSEAPVPQVWGPFTSSTWVGHDFAKISGSNWWSVEVPVTNPKAEITYQVRFNQDATVKYQKATGNFSADPTITTTTDEIKVDGSNDGNYTWNGNEFYLSASSTSATTETEWNGSTWTNGTPEAFSNVIISDEFTTALTCNNLTVATGGEFTPSGNVECNDLTIESGGSFLLPSGQDLSVTGSFLIKSDATGTGSYIQKGNLTKKGNITVQRYLTGSNDATNPNGRMWYVSPQVSGATAAVFGNLSGAPYNKLWSHTEGGVPAYQQITSGATTLDVMKGYVIRPWQNTTFEYTGTIYTGAQGANNNCQLTTGAAAEGWNLLGNPYTSAIDWSAGSGIARTNVYNTVVFRSNGAFVTYNGDGGVGTFGTGAAGIIPAGQAFWVKVNPAKGKSTGGVQLNSDCQVINSQALYKAPVETDNQIIRLFIQREEFADEAVIYFNENASDKFDNYDSPKFANSNDYPAIYTISGVESRIVINGLSTENKNNYELPLGFQSYHEGEFKITSPELSNLKDISAIYLHDTETGNIIELSENMVYTFWSAAVETENRFKLIINPAVTAIEQLQNETNKNEISIYSFSNKVVVSGKELNGSQISIFNLSGQCVFTEILKNENRNIFEMNLLAGIYTVRVTKNGKVSTQKLMVDAR